MDLATFLSLAKEVGVLGAIAIVSGVVIWKGFNVVYPDIRDRAKAKQQAELERQAKRDEEEATERQCYIDAIRQGAQGFERVAAMLDKLGQKLDAQPNEELVQAVTKLIERTDLAHTDMKTALAEHNANATRRFDKLEEALRR